MAGAPRGAALLPVDEDAAPAAPPADAALRLRPEEAPVPAPPPKRLRLRGKQATQSALAQLPDFALEEDTNARKMVYLVTLPHPRSRLAADGTELVAPETLSKEQILHALLAACGDPEYLDGHNMQAKPPVELVYAGIFRELHKPDGAEAVHAHFHMPVRGGAPFRFVAVKRALLHKSGLASHWSMKHAGYWSAVRYVAVPTPTKPASALDTAPLLWAAQGQHPALHDCCHEPLTAAALQRRRTMSAAAASEAGRPEPRVTEMDIYALVVRCGFQNRNDERHAHQQLIQYVKNHCSAATQAFVFRIRDRLPKLIDDIWAWERVDDALAVAEQTRLQAVQAAAIAQCTCHGEWAALVVASLMLNGIPIAELRRQVLGALTRGRSETAPVLVLAGVRGGEGKSLFLKPLLTVFGAQNVFCQPQKNAFPLMDLPGNKVVLLGDWRFTQVVLPFATQCLWFDGSAVPISRPQNQAGVQGHCLYQGAAPIFGSSRTWRCFGDMRKRMLRPGVRWTQMRL